MSYDTTKPNSARMYDCLLGGTHNYPADQAAVQKLMEMEPSVGEGALLFRYFLHRAARQLAQSSFTCYLDLATGLPTEGYLHELVPESAKVIYNDIDPETVAYAREIIDNRPNIQVIQGDLRNIGSLLAEAERFFGDERRIGICLVNVSYHIDDEPLSHVFRQLYDWTAPGSQLAISGIPPAKTDRQERLFDFYRKIGTPLFLRTEDELLQLAAPWRTHEAFRPIETFAEESLQIKTLKDNEIRGNAGYGGILTR